MLGRRDVPQIGAVVAGSTPLMPYVVVDGAGAGVDVVNRYLRDRMLGDVSPLTCRSYGYDLLRWFRLLWLLWLLWLLEVDWGEATEAETAVMVGWLRNAGNPQRTRRPGSPQPGSVNVRTGKPEPGAGYAPATIAHVLTVVSGFYDFHMHFGGGPLLNPLPQNTSRRAVLSHRSPLEDPRPHRRARLRPKLARRMVRSIPDGLFEELFAQMRSDRDRALLAFYVSSGARASELLGLRMDDIDWPGKKIHVISKGSRLREAIPASPYAFVYLACYLGKAGPPQDGTPVWRALRGPERPLTYSAMRQVLERANALLSTNWTLHDLRHDGGQARGGSGRHARRDPDDHAARAPDHHPAVYDAEAG